MSQHFNNNEAVILLHGLARTKRSLSKLERALTSEGYHVINVNYPSRKQSIQSLAAMHITQAVAECGRLAIERIHFVTHSMGGILLRHYLSTQRPQNLGRIVMLSPPNRGSEVVDTLSTLPGFYTLNGPAGQQLGTNSNSLPNQLGAVDYPVGIITGNKSINWILSLMIPGENDGKVSVERAKLAGMRDFLVLPVSHPFIMRSTEVIQQTTHFLRHEKFAAKPQLQ